MKTAIFKDWDVTQIILTPETEIDKEIDKILSWLINVKFNWLWKEPLEVTPINCKIMKWWFYACSWWWTRQGTDTQSIIFQF